MCNEWAAERVWREYCEMMAREEMAIISDELPELPLGSIRPSDRAPVIRAAPGGSRLDLLAWGWPPPPRRGGLVINVRSETRKDPAEARGIGVFATFYEHRDDGGRKKSKFAFSPAINEPMALALVIRDDRFALVTSEPGPDVAVVHHRTPVVLKASDWRRYLSDPVWPTDLMQPPLFGTLKCVQIR